MIYSEKLALQNKKPDKLTKKIVKALLMFYFIVALLEFNAIA